MKKAMNKAMKKQDGFTLLEVLISMAILSIGSLGVLALVTTSIQLNQKSQHYSEASLVGQFLVDQLQVVGTNPIPDPMFVTGCATGTPLSSMCLLNGSVKAGGPGATTSISQLRGGAPSGLKFQVAWAATALTGANQGLWAINVVVRWPRNRNLAGLVNGQTGFVDCMNSANDTLCHRMDFHSYRR